MPAVLLAQKSDLHYLDHKTAYLGDSTDLKALTEPLRGAHPLPLIERSQLCHDTIEEIGTLLVNAEEHRVLYVNHSFGISCRGRRLILFYRKKQFVGHYNTDYVLNLKCEGSKLLFQHEGLGPFEAISFAEGFPEKAAFTKNDYSGFRKWKH